MAILRAGANLSDTSPLRSAPPFTMDADKTVAIPRHGTPIDDHGPPPRVTFSRKSDPPHVTVPLSKPLPAPAVPSDKTVIMTRTPASDSLADRASKPPATAESPLTPMALLASKPPLTPMAPRLTPEPPLMPKAPLAPEAPLAPTASLTSKPPFTPERPLAPMAPLTPEPPLTAEPPFTPRPPRPTRSMRAVWLGAALLAVVAGVTLYMRPVTTSAARAARDGVGGTLEAVQPTAAAAEPGTVIQDCPTCPRMTVLPAGRFKQGSAYDDRDALPAEKPQHIVRIRQPLAMAATEITVADFREFAADTNIELAGCETYDGEWHSKANASWKEPGFSQTADHPVTCVSWNDAVEYAAWLSAKTGHHYRLPSASEWEYAARAGSNAQMPWSPGLQAACENANVADRSAARRYPKWSVFACKDGYVNTAPVGSFKANAFGIDDMLGNVAEWTQDCWHNDYVKAPIDGSARMDGDCSEHELRGGSWFSSPAFVRLAYRNHYATGFRSSSIGVRLVREMTP